MNCNRVYFTAALLLSAAAAYGQIELSGALSGTLTDTTYFVVDTIYVEETDSLVIRPGAVLLFQGDYDFNIYGYLNAAGTISDTIKFLPADVMTTWRGLDFYSTASDSCRLEYCTITGSAASGVDIFGASPVIRSCYIHTNEAGSSGGGIYCNSSSSPVVVNCVIENNSAFIGGGVYSASSTAVFNNCLIINNSSPRYGGGICCTGEGTTFYQCQVKYNLCDNDYTTAYGGGVYISGGSPIFDHCFIYNNFAGVLTDGVGGGIYSTYSEPQILYCNFENNEVGQQMTGDGAAMYFMESSGLVSHCELLENAALNMAGGIFCEFSDLEVINCTMVHNEAGSQGGGIYIGNYVNVSIVNSIFESNSGDGTIYINDSQNPIEISYSDFHDNWGGNFTGDVPAGLGVVSTVNANGDSCDQFYNIYIDPYFFSPGELIFTLHENSPCIDAGDPLSPFDPDSTVADMGAYYFHQNSSFEVTLTPHNTPIIIPGGGGNFAFGIVIQNVSGYGDFFDAWTMAMLPDSSMFGPIILRESIFLMSGDELSRDTLFQYVPAGAPAGEYTYFAYAGDYPEAETWDSFNFSKPADGGGQNIGWEISGWGDESLEEPVTVAEEFVLLSVYPNPFNAATTITFSLPTPGEVKLKIFDTTGREAASLVSGHLSLGNHTVAWDAEGMASGVYFIRLTVDGRESMVKRMALVK